MPSTYIDSVISCLFTFTHSAELSTFRPSFFLLLNIFPQESANQIILHLIGFITYCPIAFQKVNHDNITLCNNYKLSFCWCRALSLCSMAREEQNRHRPCLHVSFSLVQEAGIHQITTHLHGSQKYLTKTGMCRLQFYILIK